MDELTRERYPGGLPSKPGVDPKVIAERRRILCGLDGLAELADEARTVRLAAMRRKRDHRLVRAIRRWRQP